MNDPLMPFGKHKDKPISTLPTCYCKWLVENCELFGEVERAVKSRLGMPMIVELSEDERIDRAVQTTIERLVEAMEE